MPETKKGRGNRMFVLWVTVWALLCVLFATRMLVVAKVVGESMEPTYTDGSYLFAAGKNAERGDVVVVRHENDALLKRVIAVGGDTVGASGGKVFLNGEVTEEPYAAGETRDFGPVEVPEGSVFVMGDNREHSLDSRAFGCVPVKDIVGIVRLRLLNG